MTNKKKTVQEIKLWSMPTFSSNLVAHFIESEQLFKHTHTRLQTHQSTVKHDLGTGLM